MSQGHWVQVWALPGKFPFETAKKLGIPVSPLNGPLRLLVGGRSWVRQSGVELVHAHTGSAHTLAVCLSGISSKPMPVIRTLGEARPVRKRFGSSWIYRRTQHVFCATEAIRHDFLSVVNYPMLRVSTVYPGMDWPRLFVPPVVQGPKIRVGVLGRLDAVKGMEDFLTAAALVRARFPDVQFWIAGRPANIPVSTLQQRASRLKLDANVHWDTEVEDVPLWMERCSVGVVPSIGSEAVSRVTMEWMASGRPVVATRVGCLSEWIEEGENGYLVPPHSPQQLAERILRLIRSPEEMLKMAAKSRERYERYFTLRRFTEEALEIYRELMDHIPS